ncbi:MAG TPA: OmpA family protein [Phycisphaerae bacterium]|nr:OmpA family protein [Phycisphaerae bacterium]
MQRFSAVIVLALAACLTLVSAGCVDEAKYNAVLLRNREQEKLLQEKEAQLATLNERVSALQARSGDAQRMLQEKEDHLATVMKERDEVRKAFDDLMDAYKKLAGGGWGAGGKLPEAVSIAIEQLANDYPGLFDFDRATGRLRFKADITFDSGSNVVKVGARGAIAKLGGILVSDVARGIVATIVGHTDTDPVKKATTIALLKELGKATDNQGLSEARAESVADILKGAGVEATRITTRGVGSAQAIAPNTTAGGKAQNRRVEIFLSKGP